MSRTSSCLHAYAGSGKTSTAAEFVRWYRQTGGVSGPVLFTSFEQHKPLPRVLDELGRVFESVLAKNRIQWLTIGDAQRRDVALQLLRQVPVLWIWDNVEPITGFPAGTPSAWTAAEQDELLDFLRAGRGTRAKFLLTSRRDERDWLHDLPARIELPPMSFDECVQMTRELAKKLGRRLGDVVDWRPLIRFTQGNPLTLTVLVGQALRDGLKSREQIADFVRKLRAGEAVFEDEASEGRTRSLAASLAYGFEHAFTQAERKQLALLHLFQGFVEVAALLEMGDPESEWCLPEVKDLTREVWIDLLHRAAELGLLITLGGGYYSIHPALPWFFRRLFEQYYSETRIAATRAFVEAIGLLGDYYTRKYAGGDRDVISALTAEETNLLHARALARSNGWWLAVIGPMQGLRQLYQHTGRRAEWSRLVEEIVPDFVDPATEGPLPGRQDAWSLVTGYRVTLAEEARRWEEADRLQRLDVDWNRQRAAPILAKPAQTWSAHDKHLLGALGRSVHGLAEIQQAHGSASCVDGYREALSLGEKIQDSPLIASCAFYLGHAYARLDGIRDYVVAEQWYTRSLELRAKEDKLGRARSLIQLGYIAYLRFLEAQESGRRPDECTGHFSHAEQYSKEAIEMIPVNALQDLAGGHNLLGIIYGSAGQIDTALRHFRESIRYREAMQDRFEAGTVRWNAALALADGGRLADAREWAQSAMRDFQACENADQDVIKTLKLLEHIESDLRGTSPPS